MNKIIVKFHLANFNNTSIKQVCQIFRLPLLFVILEEPGVSRTIQGDEESQGGVDIIVNGCLTTRSSFAEFILS